MTLRLWFDIAIFLCGAVAALGVLALALEMRRKMPQWPLPARRSSGKEEEWQEHSQPKIGTTL